MFNIPRIEKPTFYIDQAMNDMQQYAQKERNNIEERYEKNKNPKQKEKSGEEIRLNKRKDLELQKIRHLNDKVNIALKKIILKYPKFRRVEDIYKKLIDTNEHSVATIEDALKRLNWIASTVDELTQKTEEKIKKARTQETTGFLMKKYLGRVNSLFSKNKEFFKILEESRRFMNKMPTFEELYTTSIGGFPNVGKSTLMNKLTGSKVEIQNYPFTTKGLMFSYIKVNDNKIIQLIDTPGLLGRENKSNNIEKRAQIILTQYSDSIVFVLDFTETCGFSISQQLKLLKETKASEKPIVLYLSKTDIFDGEANELKEDSKIALKKYEVFEDPKKLRDYLIKQRIKDQKFNVNEIKTIK
jgi:nucleolar GTP-binding protein